MVMSLALPVWAQHASHAGSASHSAPPSRAGSRPSINSHSATSSHVGTRAAGTRSSSFRGTPPSHLTNAVHSLQRQGAGFGGPRKPYDGSSHHRRPYVSTHGRGYPYAVAGFGFPGLYAPGYDSGYLDDSDSGSNDNSAPQESAEAEGDDQQPGAQQPPPWPYGSAPAASQPAPIQPPEEAVTIIFKDGRPPEQIHNYILTRTALYVGGRHQPAIPIDEIDLAATMKVNREAGVDFHLPTSQLGTSGIGTR
jgi:hypothetical protein